MYAQQSFTPKNVHEYCADTISEMLRKKDCITQEQATCYGNRLLNMFDDNIITLIDSSVTKQAKSYYWQNHTLHGVSQKKLSQITADIFDHIKGWPLNKQKMQTLSSIFIKCPEKDMRPAPLQSYVKTSYAAWCVADFLIFTCIGIWQHCDAFFIELDLPLTARFITTIDDPEFIRFWQSLIKIDDVSDMLREEYEYSIQASMTNIDNYSLHETAQYLYGLIITTLENENNLPELCAKFLQKLNINQGCLSSVFPANPLTKIIKMLHKADAQCKNVIKNTLGRRKMACPTYALMNMLAFIWINQDAQADLEIGIDTGLCIAFASHMNLNI